MFLFIIETTIWMFLKNVTFLEFKYNSTFYIAWFMN